MDFISRSVFVQLPVPRLARWRAGPFEKTTGAAQERHTRAHPITHTKCVRVRECVRMCLLERERERERVEEKREEREEVSLRFEVLDALSSFQPSRPPTTSTSRSNVRTAQLRFEGCFFVSQ